MNKLAVFQEPGLEFGLGQRLQHPRDGITLFGPFDTKGIERPRHITYALFGSLAGVELFRAFSGRLNRPIATEGDYEEVLWPHFPGFEEAFQAVWAAEPVWVGLVDDNKLTAALDIEELHERVYTVVNLYLEAMKIAKQRDETFHVFVCVVPDVLFARCRTTAAGHVVSKREKWFRESTISDFFKAFDPRQYGFSLDFRRQIKARVMELEVPIQIVRESTLRLRPRESMAERDLTPLSDRAWNLSTALYYKSGGKPWKLSTARDGVCYVGVAFKDTEDQEKNACSAAQMFLDDGDGVVFLGDYGRWYSEKWGEYHLTRQAAKKLLAGVLKT